MTEQPKKETTDAARQEESGQPGGGVGRRDEVGGSGVYPASAGNAPADAEIRTPMAWGQGDRGAAGYEDSGQSELHFTEEELRAAEEQGRTRESGDGAAQPQKETRDRSQ
jgi:hypothetical protein